MAETIATTAMPASGSHSCQSLRISFNAGFLPLPNSLAALSQRRLQLETTHPR
jgi:hypothetical protein